MPNETFELKKEHIKLLSAASFYSQNSYTNAPAMDSKRPYGNSSWHTDAAEALGLYAGREIQPHEKEYLEGLQSELTSALQIVCQLSTFETGVYENTAGSWRRVNASEKVSDRPISDTTLKYLYHLQLWGGFYNTEYAEQHGEKEGDFYFSTPEEREEYLKGLQKTEKKLGAHYLMHSFSEGYCWDVHTKLHRVVEYKGKRYYSEREMGVNYPYDAAKYHLENKWYPGFNSYPLGEDFTDYKNLTTVQEWITGAFTVGAQ